MAPKVLMEGVSRRFGLRRISAYLIWLGLFGLAWVVLAGCSATSSTLFSSVASISRDRSFVPPQPTASPTAIASQPSSMEEPVTRGDPLRPVLTLASPTAPASQPSPIEKPVAAGGALRSVPILMYHYVRNNPNPNDRLGEGLSVSPARFEEQMAWLAERGYETVLMVDLLRAWQGELALPPKTVALTFDDGYADAYTTAAPILARYGFRGTVFIVNRFVGKSGYLSLEQLQSLKAAGWEIGFHSRSHVDLSRLSTSQLQTEVVTAAAELRQLVDAPVLSFAYPSGRYNPQGDWLLQPRLRIAGQLGIAGFAALFRTP